MSSITRVNGLKATVDKVYNNGVKIHLVTVKNAAGSARDLRAEDDAVDEVVESIVKDLNPLWYYTADGSGGIMQIIMPSHLTASEIQIQIRNLGTTVGPNNVDVTGTTVQDNYIVISGLLTYGD